jgi:hypothetical protein
MFFVSRTSGVAKGGKEADRPGVALAEGSILTIKKYWNYIIKHANTHTVNGSLNVYYPKWLKTC